MNQDQVKKLRKPYRANLTKTINTLGSEVKLATPDVDKLELNLRKAEMIILKLKQHDEELFQLMVQGNCDDDDLEKESTLALEYVEKFEAVKIAVNRILIPVNQQSSSGSSGSSLKQDMKLPKVELKKFNGELTEWLGFWSQFQKIHDNKQLPDCHKFQYLVQSMEPGTAARELVEGYPQTEANYKEAVSALTQRFGRNDLLHQVYVRELLKLVINNATSKDKLSFSSFFSKVQSHLRSLTSLNLIAVDPKTWLYPLVESGMPEEKLLAWHRSPLSKKDGSTENPPRSKLDHLIEFMETEVLSDQQIDLAKTGFKVNDEARPKVSERVRKSNQSTYPTAAGLFMGEGSSCVFCGSDHESKECANAREMEWKDKRARLRAKRVCFKCIQPGHNAGECSTFVCCLICGKPHMTVMCQGVGQKSDKKPEKKMEHKEAVPKPSEAGPVKDGAEPSTSSGGLNVNCSREILMKTVLVNVAGADDKRYKARLLFDEGTQLSCISSRAVETVGSIAQSVELSRNVLFDGSVTPFRNVNKHKIVLTSLDNKKKASLILREKPQLGGRIPRVPTGPWLQELKNRGVLISDVDGSGVNTPDIDIVVGSDYWGTLMTGGMVKLANKMIAVESVFGWTLSGPVSSEDNCVVESLGMLALEEDCSKLWNMEVIGIQDPVSVRTKKDEENKAMSIFKQTVKRNDDGRYQVKLPWNNEMKEVPSNKRMAECRLRSVTKRLEEKDRVLPYHEVFSKWEAEGLIEEVCDDGDNGHYLPHHPVFKDSLTTPVRPVFDASFKSGRFPSLNDCLYKGPNFVELLPSVLLRFRERTVGAVSDIRKAFQMIDMHPDDRKFLRFLWWQDPTAAERRLRTYQHKRVVFGVNCSPFLLAAVLDLHLSSVKGGNELIATKLKRALYVDNCVTSFDSHEDYEDFKEKSVQIMAEAKMDLTQWEFTMRETGVGRSSEWCGLGSNVNDYTDEGVKVVTSVLGMKWDKSTDEMFLDMKNVEPMKAYTKRSILSALHKVYDPIGFSCPALILPKILIQEACKRKGDWDAELPINDLKEFQKWYEEVHLLQQIRIPRHCQLSGDSRKSLHIFCDASKRAFATVVYLRSETDDQCEVQLLLAKSRITPMKDLSIPRLELMSCLIGTRLSVEVIEALELHDVARTYWTDSTTALAWIRRNDEWGTFVGNRVREILGKSEVEAWKHVPGKINPADLPSRGCSPNSLLESRWWEGPDWLKCKETDWPYSDEPVDENLVNEEKRKSSAAMANVGKPSWFTTKFTSYSKNVLVMGWVRRFIWNSKPSNSKNKGTFLMMCEVVTAERELLKIIQEDLKYEEKTLNPLRLIKMQDGVIHVKTALLNRVDREEFVLPILLPREHPLVHGLIHEVHLSYGHGGAQFLMGKLREKYWITQSRKTISKVIRRCGQCRRFDSKPLQVEPAALPARRVTDGEVFDTTGVDLAGPLFLKDGSKAWIVVYTCAVYRCISLDFVTSLDTKSFVGNLERFVFTNGRPNTIISDNGTNFHGANNMFKKIDWSKLEKMCHAKKINWIFNPPYAPWWGGFWERVVKTVKDLLRRMLGRAKLNSDELRNVLAAVTHTINERPLTTVTEDVEDLRPLTPAMFMRGTKGAWFPEGDIIDGKALQCQFHRIQELRKGLQCRFRKEYLALLVRRGKEKPSKLKLGQVVLVGSENKKRFEWPLGRIIELMPGKDGVVRLVKLKTLNGSFVRPVQRLYPLESEGELTANKREEVDVTGDVSAVEETSPEVITSRGRVVKKPCRYDMWNV